MKKGANLFAKRRMDQAKATKRAKTTKVLKSPRTQQLENMQLQQRRAEEQQQRLEQSRLAEKRNLEERREREALAEEQQRKALEQARQDGKDGAESDQAETRRRKLPSKRKGTLAAEANQLDQSTLPEASQTPQAPQTPQFPRPVFVPTPVYSTVATMADFATPPENLDKVKEMISSGLDASVFCAPYADGHIRTWEELAMPEEANPLRNDYISWTKPEAWVSLPDDYQNGNPSGLVSITQTGNYNNILAVSAGTPVSNPSSWPPQLSNMGLGTDLERSKVLPQADYILRMTRTDPFKSRSGSNSPPMYRSMTREQVVTEMSLSLLTASQGVGLPVHACVAWKWKPDSTDTQQMYGLVMVLRRSEGDMNVHIEKLRRTFPRTPEGPSKNLIRMAEEAAVNTIGLCFHLGWMGLINFDMKPANMLMREINGMFYLSDFDGVFYRQVSPEVGGVKTCFFVNLLLMCFQVQSYVNGLTFPSAFLATTVPILLELWTEAVRSPGTFGPGAEWLTRTVLTIDADDGEFDQGLLKRLPPAQLYAAQLKMMIYEYGFSTSEGKNPSSKVKSFPWDTKKDFFSGPSLLVPQLLRYIVLYNNPVPPGYEDLFASRAPR